MGANQSKPGVDWNVIRAEFEGGSSLRELARQHHITHRAIQKRRDKEGWDEKSAILAAATKTPSVILQATGLATTRHRGPEQAKCILESLQKGLPYRTAAALAGTSEDTLMAWRDSDPAFSELCRRSIELWHASKLGQIDGAADRGDWKAAQFRLAHHHATREDYAERGNSGATFNVTLNIGRGEDKPTIIIDGKPE